MFWKILFWIDNYWRGTGIFYWVSGRRNLCEDD